MKKIQVLFPEPMLERLKAIAKADDRPLSEVVRRSVEFWLERVPPPAKDGRKKKFPFFDGGDVLVDAKRMREAIYEDTP
jgi:hypothetical protein